MNKEAFYRACEEVKKLEQGSYGFGSLGEKTLHAVLKFYLEPNSDLWEVGVGRYIADIANQDGIIEIQTRDFNRLRSKLEFYLETRKVTIVHPIPGVKWLCWVDPDTGEITKKRKSPKAAGVYDAFKELYKIKNFLKHPNLHIKLIMLEMTEYRLLNGWSKDGKKGSTRQERIPEDILEEFNIESAEDYGKMIPSQLTGHFTVTDYAKAAKITENRARTALNVLLYMGAVTRVGKDGRKYLYSID